MKAWLLTLAAAATPLVHADGQINGPANGLSWNYFDAEYVYSRVTVEDGDETEKIDLDGGNFEGSLMFAENWMFQASYSTTDASFENVATSADTFGAGAAYRFAISDNFNALVGGGYAYVQTDARAFVNGSELRFDADSQGAYLNGKVRGRFGRRFEAEGIVAGVYYEDDFFEEDIIYGIKGRFYVTPLFAIAIGVSGSKESDDPLYSVGLRLQGQGLR